MNAQEEDAISGNTDGMSTSLPIVVNSQVYTLPVIQTCSADRLVIDLKTERAHQMQASADS